MKVIVSCKDSENHKSAEKEMQTSIKKLETLLKTLDQR